MSMSSKDSSRAHCWSLAMLVMCSVVSTVLARSAATTSLSSSNTLPAQVAAVPSSSFSKQHRSAATLQQHQHQQQQQDQQPGPAVVESSADVVPEAVSSAKSAAGGESIWSELEFVYSTYRQCSDVDLSVCLKLKLVNALNGAARSVENIEPVEGIRFVSLNKADGSSESASAAARQPIVSDSELLATLPRSVEGQESALSSMIWDRIVAFFQSHTLQIKFPTADELRAAAAAAEGRGKDKKHHGYIMIPLLLGSTIIPIAYGALALLAGKALIVSKLALVLASIIGIKKLVSHSSDSGGGSRRIATDEAETAEWSRKFELPQSVLQQS